MGLVESTGTNEFTGPNTFQQLSDDYVPVTIRSVIDGSSTSLWELYGGSGSLAAYFDQGGNLVVATLGITTSEAGNYAVTLYGDGITGALNALFGDLNGQIGIVGNQSDPPLLARSMGRVNRTAQAAAIAATNLTLTAPAALYAIQYEMTCTTGDVTAGTLTFDVIATGDGGAQTISSTALPLSTAALSATNPVRGTLVRYLASGNIQYSTTVVTGAVNAARYALRARPIYLG